MSGMKWISMYDDEQEEMRGEAEEERQGAREARRQQRTNRRQQRANRRQQIANRRAAGTNEEIQELLPRNSTAGNKLQFLHNTGRGNQYYKGKKRLYNRGNKQRVLANLQRHRERRNYTGREHRGQLLENTIGQLTQEIRQNNADRREAQERRNLNILRLVGANLRIPENNSINWTNNNSSNSNSNGKSNNSRNVRKGGSKKRKQQVKGRRVLKNGAVAGYVKQRDGTWKWRFLPR